MTVSALIKKFSGRFELPVDVEEISEAIRERGVKDEIYFFWDSHIDTGNLSGFIEHWEYTTDGEARRVAEITYARSSNEQERLVCAKEMLHILDPDRALVSGDKAIEALMDRIILPPDMVDLVKDGIPALTDRVAIAQALAVLFPFAARQVLLPYYKAKKLDLASIAERAELPPRYVSAVMSDTWEQVHEMLVSI